MWWIIALEGAAFIYAGAYAWHCFKRAKPLAVCGAVLLMALAGVMGVLLVRSMA